MQWIQRLHEAGLGYTTPLKITSVERVTHIVVGSTTGALDTQDNSRINKCKFCGGSSVSHPHGKMLQ